MALISAHQCGAGPGLDYGSFAMALRKALNFDCEYVEFDVQATADEQLVCLHDNRVSLAGRSLVVSDAAFGEVAEAVPGVVLYDDALATLRGRKKAHLDLKFDQALTPPDPRAYVAAARRAVAVLGAENALITTGPAGVAAIRRWSHGAEPALLVACATGLSCPGFASVGQIGRFLGADRLVAQIKTCDANLVAAAPAIARRGLAQWASRVGLPLMVWTIDGKRQLNHWLGDPRVAIVTTNRPVEAAAIRRQRELASGRTSGGTAQR
ncbi:MAG: glycerophosphodiester phosphodiesterase [Nocardioidaceae bacterium]